MRLNNRLPQRTDLADDADPREQQSAEIIDLATRNVIPAVASKKGPSDAWGLVTGVALVALLGTVTLWSLDGARSAQQQAKPKQQTAAPLPAAASVDTAPAVPLAAITPQSGSALAAPQPQSVLSAPPQGATLTGTAANPASSPTIVFDASALPAPAPMVQAGVPQVVPTGPNTGGTPTDDFASRIGGVGGTTATAAVTVNPRTTVTQGTLIPAVLETAIDTDQPGYVRAIVSADVRSFDGARVLIPRSSRLIGQYKSGLQAGQKRAYVVWTRLIRPDGVSVNIASPAIGFGGETGLAGKVDTHFWDRFGSAMLLSVVGGLVNPIGTAGVIVAGGGQSAAAAAVGQGSQIGPTIRVRQGEPIRVFTARDLDFSQVATQ